MIKYKRLSIAPLIVSFIAANCSDTAITLYALTLPGFTEIGILAGSYFLMAIIIKVIVVTGLAGAYMWAVTNQSQLEYVLKKTLQYSTTIVWGITVLNIAQVVWEMMR